MNSSSREDYCYRLELSSALALLILRAEPPTLSSSESQAFLSPVMKSVRKRPPTTSEECSYAPVTPQSVKVVFKSACAVAWISCEPASDPACFPMIHSSSMDATTVCKEGPYCWSYLHPALTFSDVCCGHYSAALMCCCGSMLMIPFVLHLWLDSDGVTYWICSGSSDASFILKFNDPFHGDDNAA